MTREELQRRMDALCALRGEPAGTVVASAREADSGKWVACVAPADMALHPLTIVARGASEGNAYDSAWAQAARYMEECADRAIAASNRAMTDAVKAERAMWLACETREAVRRFSDE